MNDDLYTTERAIRGPLFDAGPFDHSEVEPTKEEGAVAELIWKHQSARNPIAIVLIREATQYDERSIKGVVEQLRTKHRLPIGGRREPPAGYFWINNAADREVAVAPYRKQILTMWNTLRILDSVEHLRELRDQMTVEVPE
jgi:hypothetical protein